jgi:predicted glutamine amidotransferase
MCRFYAHHANRPTPAADRLLHCETSLRAQSRRDTRGESHVDGWGIGYYEGDRPRVVRRATSATECGEYSAAAAGVCAATFLAHVRQASVGERSTANTHPFAFGRWLFAHNGTVTGFDRVGPLLRNETSDDLLAAVKGTTDSELLFHWLLTRLRSVQTDLAAPCRDLAAMPRVVAESIVRLDAASAAAGGDEPAKLNFLLSDGRFLLASCFGHSLHWINHIGPAVVDNGTDPSATTCREYRAAVVASEPVTQEAWQEIPDRSILVIDADIQASVYRF